MKFQLIYLISDILLNVLSQGSGGKCHNIRQGVRGVLQYSLSSDGKCFNIPQGVRGMHQYFLGNDVGLGKSYYYHGLTATSSTSLTITGVDN